VSRIAIGMSVVADVSDLDFFSSRPWARAWSYLFDPSLYQTNPYSLDHRRAPQMVRRPAASLGQRD